MYRKKKLDINDALEYILNDEDHFEDSVSLNLILNLIMTLLTQFNLTGI